MHENTSVSVCPSDVHTYLHIEQETLTPGVKWLTVHLWSDHSGRMLLSVPPPCVCVSDTDAKSREEASNPTSPRHSWGPECVCVLHVYTHVLTSVFDCLCEWISSLEFPPIFCCGILGCLCVSREESECSVECLCLCVCVFRWRCRTIQG